MFGVIHITDLLLSQLEPLLVESQREGFRFLCRLKDEWLSGVNRFDQAGEGLFGVIVADELVAIGGLNRESGACGRLRRFYVAGKHRRKGVGRLLARHILMFGVEHFEKIVLHTETPAAEKFYRSLGFRRITGCANPTHSLTLNHENCGLAKRGGVAVNTGSS